MRCSGVLIVSLFLTLDILSLLADHLQYPAYDAGGTLEEDCRIEFLSPAPGEKLFAGEDVVVELSIVGCPDLSERLDKILEWDGAEALHFREDAASATLPALPAGHYTLFAFVECDSSCRAAVNGTAFFSVKAAVAADVDPPVGSVSEQVRALVAELLGNETLPWGVPRTALARAMQEFLPGTMQSSPDPKSWLQLGRLLQAAGRLDAAIDAFSASITACSPAPSADSLVVDACSHLTQALEMRAALSPAGVSRLSAPERRSFEDAYLSHLRAALPLDRRPPQNPQASAGAPDVAFGIVSGTGLYLSRALAVAETWLAHVPVGYIFGDSNATLPTRVCTRSYLTQYKN
jgi:hypothetical protein